MDNAIALPYLVLPLSFLIVATETHKKLNSIKVKLVTEIS
jgi:hypothetical protein